MMKLIKKKVWMKFSQKFRDLVILISLNSLTKHHFKVLQKNLFLILTKNIFSFS